ENSLANAAFKHPCFMQSQLVVRRGWSLARVVPAALVEELGAGDDRLDQPLEPVAVGREPLAHRGERWLVGEPQRAAKREREELPAEVLNEVVSALLVQVATQAVERFAFGAVGEGGLGDHRPAAEVALAPFADRAVALERQADRVEPLVAAQAAPV